MEKALAIKLNEVLQSNLNDMVERVEADITEEQDSIDFYKEKIENQEDIPVAFRDAVVEDAHICIGIGEMMIGLYNKQLENYKNELAKMGV